MNYRDQEHEQDQDQEAAGARRASRGSFSRWGIRTPEQALDRQIQQYRRMTGEERLELALSLHELACDLAREGIRNQNPHATEAEVERLLRERISRARSS